MSDDFLKKIQNTKNKNKNNPFDKIFQKKREHIAPLNEKKEDENNSFDGIENLGQTGTPRDDFQFNDNKVPPKDNVENKIPVKNIENDNILEDKVEVDALNISTSSSFNDLVLEDENTKILFNEKVINKIVSLLKENKPDEAIKLIKDTQNDQK